MLYLKQSTASQAVLIGPFVDDTDGATAETGLTIANTDIRVSKNGGNMASKNSGGGTHDEAGWYQITLDATDTNTVGSLQVSVDVAGALPVWAEFQVLEEVVYDALFASGATGDLDVNVASISGDSTAADNLELMFDGTGYAGGTTKLGVDVVAVSGDTTAADNLELQFDGTGLTGGTYPSTQSQLDNFSAGGGSPNVVAESVTVTTGSETNAYTDTDTLNGTYHQITPATGNTEFYYQFDVGESGIPTSVRWNGYAQSNNDSYQLYFYNWGEAGWDQVGTLAAANGTAEIEEVWLATTAHVGTGGNEGKVRFRVVSTDGTNFFTNRILCSYATSLNLSSITADIDANSTQLAAIVADTNELQTDWADGGRLDLIVDGILTDTAEIGTAGAGLTAIPWNAAWDAEVQSEVADGLAAFAWSGITISAVSGAVGSVTGTVGGVAGTIQTLDALDTAQDSQHAATQTLVAALNDISTADIDTALATYDAPTRAELTTDTNSILAKLLAYFRVALRSDAAIATDNATELTAINADSGSGAGDYANTADSQEAIRDNGGGDATAANQATIISALTTVDGIVDDILVDTGTTLPGLIGSPSVDLATDIAAISLGNTTITPVTSTVSSGEVVSDSITYYTSEGKAVALTIVDGSGSAVDMSAKTLKFVVETTRNKTDKFTVSGGSIVVSGANNNIVTITCSAANIGTVETQCVYSLRDTADSDRVWASGSFNIEYTPIGD